MPLSDVFALVLIGFLAGAIAGARVMEQKGRFIPANHEYDLALDAPRSAMVPSTP